jgi:hypothetical protein
LLGPGDTAEGAAYPAFAVADANGDGIPDVAAVVVRSVGGRLFLSSVCINGGKETPHRVFWLEKDVDLPTYSIEFKQQPRLVLPWHCIACESDPWFAWSGVEYEANLRFVGDVLYLWFPAGSSEPVPVSSVPGGRELLAVPAGTRVQVKNIGKKVAGTRWYEVEIEQGRNTSVASYGTSF